MSKAKKEKPLKISIACGQRVPKGFVGMDIADIKGVDYVGNILDFWSKDNVWSKIKDNSVDEIECSHFVEHIPHIAEGRGMIAGYHDLFYMFFDEVYRVLKPAKFDEDNPNIPISGFGVFTVPYYSSMRADQDPTHQRRIGDTSLCYLDKTWREANGLDHYPIKADFNYVGQYNMNGRLQNRNQEFVQNAFLTELNAIDDLIFTLWKK